MTLPPIGVPTDPLRMAQSYARGTPTDWLTATRPLKSDIPPVAKPAGYLEIDHQLIVKAYQLRQQIGKTAVHGLSRVSSETMTNTKPKRLRPGMRDRAATFVEPCGRVFHRIE